MRTRKLLAEEGGQSEPTFSSNQISLVTVIVNSKNNSKTSNKPQKEKTDRGEKLLEPTVVSNLFQQQHP